MCQPLLFSNLSLLPGAPTPHPPSLRSLLLILLSGWRNMAKSLSLSFTTTSHRAAGRRPVRHIPPSLGPAEQRFRYDEEMKRGLSGPLQPVWHHRQEIDGQVLLQEKYFNRPSLIVFAFLFGPFVWYCRLLLTLHWAELAVFSLGGKKSPSSQKWFTVTAPCSESRTAAARSLYEIFNWKFRQFELTGWDLNSSAAAGSVTSRNLMFFLSLLRDTVISDLLGYQRTALRP